MTKKKKLSYIERRRLEKKLVLEEIEKEDECRPSDDVLIEVLRLEAVVGDTTYGPFVSHVHDKSHDRVNRMYTRDLTGPVIEPEEEGIPLDHSMILGCLNYETFSEWLPYRCTLNAMYEVGFYIGVYEVPYGKLHVGDTQVAWSRKDGVLKEKLKLHDLEEEFFEKDRFQTEIPNNRLKERVGKSINRRKRK